MILGQVNIEVIKAELSGYRLLEFLLRTPIN